MKKSMIKYIDLNTNETLTVVKDSYFECIDHVIESTNNKYVKLDFKIACEM